VSREEFKALAMSTVGDATVANTMVFKIVPTLSGARVPTKLRDGWCLGSRPEPRFELADSESASIAEQVKLNFSEGASVDATFSVGRAATFSVGRAAVPVRHVPSGLGIDALAVAPYKCAQLGIRSEARIGAQCLRYEPDNHNSGRVVAKLRHSNSALVIDGQVVAEPVPAGSDLSRRLACVHACRAVPLPPFLITVPLAPRKRT
jgi:hypothetical protein